MPSPYGSFSRFWSPTIFADGSWAASPARMASSAAIASTWPCCHSTMQSVVRGTPTGTAPTVLSPTFASVVDPLVAQTRLPLRPAADVTLLVEGTMNLRYDWK